nr:pentatricopeptide repeat-containing protein, chloroplastic [Quercus suber]
MARGLIVLIALVLVHLTCCATTAMPNRNCTASSCGNIHNISDPFRLKSDPEYCGSPLYELKCENNRTVLQLYDGKFYVEEISYNNYTIRIVDSGIQKNNYFSTPNYSLYRYNFGSLYYTTYQRKGTVPERYPELSRSLVWMSCEKPVNSPLYLDTSTCNYNDNSSSRSDSKRYRYVTVGITNASQVEDSCQVEKMSLTSWPINNDDPNISCTDVHHELAYGFELSWLDSNCYLDDANHVQHIKATFEYTDRVRGVLDLILLILSVLGYLFGKSAHWWNAISYYYSYAGLWVTPLEIVIFHLETKTVLGIPCVVAFLIYKWRKRHLSILYSKSGDWAKAKSIFDDMGDLRDLVSWTAMVSCFANNDMGTEAIVTFLQMLENGLCPNEYCFSAVIRACSNVENVPIGKMIFGFVIKSGYFESDVCVGCALIDMFVKGGGDVDLAYKVFEKMPEKNAVTWTLMITRFMQFGFPMEAVNLFFDMVLSEYVPDQFTFGGVISACAELELLNLGQQLHSWVIRTGLALDVCVACCLVDMYAKCAVNGSVDDARKVFDLMVDHNVVSWTAIITGYVQSGGRDKEAVELFCEMIEGHVSPNHFTFSSVLKACANLSDPRMGEQVYTHAVKLGLASVNCVGNSLLSMYARSGMMEDAHKAFDMLFEKNLISYNTIVDAYAKNLNSEKAFELFHEIEDIGIGASAFTFASLLSGAASIGAVGVEI